MKDSIWSGRSVLITGGTGSLGKQLTRYLLSNHPDIRRLIIFSRDEQKQFQMAQEFCSPSPLPDQQALIPQFAGFYAAGLQNVRQ